MHFNDENWNRLVVSATLFVFSSVFFGTQRAHADEIYLCEGRRVVIVTEANRQEMRSDPCVSAWRPVLPAQAKQLAAADVKSVPAVDKGPSPLASLVDHNIEKPKVRRSYSAEMKITQEKPRKASKSTRHARSDRKEGLRNYGNGILAQ